MTLEQLPVAARLVVVAVEVRGARHLDEVAIALVRLGEHREVEDLVLGALRAVEARGVGEVALHAEHRLDARVARRFVERQDAVHVAVVGDAHRGLTVGRRRRDDLADARSTVEHRVLGVEVQMDERIGQSSAPQICRPQALWTGLWMNHMSVITLPQVLRETPGFNHPITRPLSSQQLGGFLSSTRHFSAQQLGGLLSATRRFSCQLFAGFR